MSLEKISELIQDLEAIKYYEPVKRQRNEAYTINNELKETVAKQEIEINRLSDLLDNKEKDFNTEITQHKQDTDRLEELSKEAETLKGRVKDLEAYKFLAEGKTLAEAEKEFLRAKEDEITRRAEEKFSDMERSWREEDKPNEVKAAAVQNLQAVLSAREPLHSGEQLAEAGIPQMVSEILEKEVANRINAEFNKRVEAESERKSLEKLNRLKGVEWPRWFHTAMEPKITLIVDWVNTNLINFLKAPWQIVCDKCGTEQQLELTPQQISLLLTGNNVNFQCRNPNCKDLFRRHTIAMDLPAFLMGLLSPGSTEGSDLSSRPKLL